MIDRDYLRRLTLASPVDYYASGIDGARVYWPWRMNKAGAEAGRNHAAKCDSYAIDSNFKDDSVTNEDVLDKAVELYAEIAVLADVYLDADATVEALREGLETARSHDFDGVVALPLQPPHAESFHRLKDDVGDLDVWWCVGGFKDDPASVKLEATRSLRAATGPDVHIHGLGFGVTPLLARAVRADPGLLDSIDNSTAVSSAMTDTISGSDEMMSVVAARATAKRIEFLRELTPFAEESGATRQAGFEEVYAGP